MKKAKDFTKMRDNETKDLQDYRMVLSNLSHRIAKMESEKTVAILEYIEKESEYAKYVGKLEEKYGKDKFFNIKTGEITKRRKEE